MNLTRRKQTFLANWPAQSICKEETMREDRYHESTPDEMGRLEQTANGRTRRLASPPFPLGKNDSRHRIRALPPGTRKSTSVASTHHLRTTRMRKHPSMDGDDVSHIIPSNERGHTEAYAIAGPNVVPASRGAVD